MLTLRALLAAYKTLLVIDSSSACAQIGLFRAGLPSTGEWEKSIGEAGIAVFQTTDKLLRRAGVELSEIDAIAFCEGPGSVLGIRTAAVAGQASIDQLTARLSPLAISLRRSMT